MGKPSFSIIMPTHNRSSMLEEAIQSVLDQRFTDFELIVIDDGSTDNTKGVMSAFSKDKRIKYHYQQNLGKGPTRNFGLSASIGSFICFLDDDDLYLPHHLQTYWDFLQSNPGTSAILRTGVKSQLSQNKSFQSKLYTGTNTAEQLNFVLDQYFSLLDLCIPRELALHYDFPNFPLWQDKYYLMLLLSEAILIQLPEHTVVAREHADRSVNTAYKNPEFIKMQVQAIRELQKNPKIKQYVSEVTFEKTVQHIYATHITNALATDGVKQGFHLSMHLLKNKRFDPSIYTIMKTWISYFL